ncbi:MAG: hypothetical protein PHC51_05550 [bacterium]|nr:hypothetical protein [bacterium]
MSDLQNQPAQQSAERLENPGTKFNRESLRAQHKAETQQDSPADVANNALENVKAGMRPNELEKKALSLHAAKLQDMSDVVGNASANVKYGMSMDTFEIKNLQKALGELNGSDLKDTGKLDEATKQQISNYRASQGFKAGNAVDGTLLEDIANRLSDKAVEMKDASRK